MHVASVSDVTGTAIFNTSPSAWMFVQNINVSLLEDFVICVEYTFTNFIVSRGVLLSCDTMEFREPIKLFGGANCLSLQLRNMCLCSGRLG